jgi:hypothetical protein
VSGWGKGKEKFYPLQGVKVTIFHSWKRHKTGKSSSCRCEPSGSKNMRKKLQHRKCKVQDQPSNGLCGMARRCNGRLFRWLRK